MLTTDETDPNFGLATLEAGSGGSTRLVSVGRLDALDLGEIGILKVDVEGHETQVVRGAEGTLARKGVRDIVFEHEAGYPSDLTQLLESMGYGVLLMDMTLGGLAARDPRRHSATWRSGPPSYLATRDLARARARLRPRGWLLPHVGPGLRRSPRSVPFDHH
jgi:hypothetical protein